MSLAQFFGIDKLQKLARMVKEHGGVKASLYHFYLTDDLKVRVQLGRNVVCLFPVLCIRIRWIRN
jgi:hypothetical protein